jgi:hypothetical protein
MTSVPGPVFAVHESSHTQSYQRSSSTPREQLDLRDLHLSVLRPRLPLLPDNDLDLLAILATRGGREGEQCI